MALKVSSQVGASPTGIVPEASSILSRGRDQDLSILSADREERALTKVTRRRTVAPDQREINNSWST